ncbi:GbsR/MarR family transcriptional regulator [Flammeovirga sp. SJP92]|uniref:GbsR/MarR family transcriptional regulator n=1 Tax=Flammeovirga sp. SJP92 TaxID=1775430 RepID=UPI000789559E|nr:hypothetical protein [Flammeovirga sp. SJP92]KXX70386.1 hypothetical protein AVL50_11670 [Flammeovirga sp. SJP92]
MENREDISKAMSILIEEQGVLFEKSYKLSPVAARVLSVLVINGSKGVTFDFLIEIVSASKATISSSLKTLSDRKMISYFTKPGDRKRYFTINKTFFISLLEEEAEKSRRSLAMHEKINEFKKLSNTLLEDDEKFEMPNSEPSLYARYLHGMINNLDSFIKDLKKYHSLEE